MNYSSTYIRNNFIKQAASNYISISEYHDKKSEITKVREGSEAYLAIIYRAT